MQQILPWQHIPLALGHMLALDYNSSQYDRRKMRVARSDNSKIVNLAI